MSSFTFAFKNLCRKPGRTAALAVLTALLAFPVFGGSVLITSLQRGLNSLEARLGADIIVLPSSAQSKVSFKKMLLQGTTGAYYMDADVLNEVLAAPGVEKASAQTFLATLKADCCSVRIQVIGMDPETDFVVQPWIRQSIGSDLDRLDVAVGCKVEAEAGEIIRIYDERCKVAAKLAPTGTGLDTAVYCSMETMNELLKAAENKGVSHQITSDSAQRISAVYVKVKEESDIDRVNNYLNGHIRKVTAVRTRSMLTQVSDSLAAVSRTIAALIAAVWVLSLVILMIAFALMAGQRRKEFAVLRLIGLSRRKMCRVALTESALCSLLGAVAGVAAAALTAFLFAALIETSLGLPYLMPGAGQMAGMGAAAIAAAALMGSAASAFAAWKLSKADPGTALREEM